MQAVFYGVGAAVIGIIVMSAKKLTEKRVGKDKLLWAIYAVLAAVTITRGCSSLPACWYGSGAHRPGG